MSRRKKIVVANWKMNPESLKEALKIFSGIKSSASRNSMVETVICAPHLYSLFFRKKYRLLGAQDVSMETKGAHTGEVSARMLSENGFKYVIIGHSERRAMGETDEIVNKKVENALNENMKVILCVGEKTRDEHGHYLTFIRRQLRDSLKKINRKYLKNILIAYEPLFNVGNKNYEALPPHEAYQMVIFIRKTLLEHFNDFDVRRTPILYGGSVNPENAYALVKEGGVDGFLVGRESLKPVDFKQILKAISQAG